MNGIFDPTYQYINKTIEQIFNHINKNKVDEPIWHPKQITKKQLPILFLANIQSIANKLDETEYILNPLNANIACLTETWLSDKNKSTLSFNKYIAYHLTRDKCARVSGGVSVMLTHDMISSHMKINVPKHLECLWVSCRPTWLPRMASIIIICAVYYPGSNSLYAPNQDELLDHIIINVQKLKTKYCSPLFFIMGDFNDLNIDRLLATCQLSQKVKVPTRKNKTLDYIISNANDDWYHPPTSLPKIGKGDHNPVLYTPKNYEPPPQAVNKIMKRTFLKSDIIQFGSWITHYDWKEVIDEKNANTKVTIYNKVIWEKIDKHFPEKMVKLANTDKPWMTSEIKQKILFRQKAHENKRYVECNRLAKTIQKLIFIARTNYRQKNIHLLKNVGNKNWYRQINTIINPDKCSHNKLTNIPELAGKKYETMSEIINNNFAEITSNYPPLNHEQLPSYLPHPNVSKQIDEFTTYKLLKKVANKSPGPKDIPPRILSEFCPEIATPICNIINACLKQGVFPDLWKRAKIVPIPKVASPKSLNDLRPISLTPAPGKVLEKIIAEDLASQLKLDSNQYGNVKGSSTSHYLIKLMDLAFKSTDKGKATTAVTIDYSKDFDLIDHTILVKKLIGKGISENLTMLLISFLSDQMHCTKVGNKTSKYKKITCGVPQGTVNGPKLFIVMIDGDQDDSVHSFKFVDDKTIALNYSGDPTTTIQKCLDRISKEAQENNMVINASKCHSVTFNFSEKNIEPINLTINGNKIENKSSIKLLGVTLSNDLKWAVNTNNICNKVYAMLYKISKLKSFGATQEDLINVWTTMLRPSAEYAAPLWHSSLTLCESKNLEKLQKTALAIILGKTYINFKPYYNIENNLMNYKAALSALKLDTMYDRREKLTTKFAKSLIKSEKHRNMLPGEKTFVSTRDRLIISNNNPDDKKVLVKLNEVKTNTERHYMSSIPYMTRTINKIKLTKQSLNIKK